MEGKTIVAITVALAAMLISGCATSEGPKIGVQLAELQRRQLSCEDPEDIFQRRNQ
jgi:outer membrane lipoprotein-sorting protein